MGPLGQVASYDAAARGHPRKTSRSTLLGAEVRNVQHHSPSRGPASGHDLQVAGPGDHVAGRSLHLLGVVALHETLAFGVVHASARASESLLQNGARKHGLSGEESRRVKLQHLHVPQLQPGPVAHGHAVSGLLPGRGGYLVHRRWPPRRDDHDTGSSTYTSPVITSRTVTPASSPSPSNSRSRALVSPNSLGPDALHLLQQLAHDLHAREITFVHRTVEVLATECLLADAAVLRPVEETSYAGLEFLDRPRRIIHKRPGHLLIVEVFAAFQGIPEM